LYVVFSSIFAMLDSNVVGVEGEGDFEEFDEDQGQIANQGKPSFALMLLSQLHFCALLHFLSLALSLC
jgi:hypothetical protein